ncbi:AAA family ATPase [Paenibacillus alvei]|uniref:AAA family ATPase n=1 Tax=Paenibacillus alvei TaxID=44250 RepID=UPI0018CF2ECE|nr:MoxR family ATPase [Paenibacillus alvei]MCY9578269.1 MoxR family ATPase [Paenibacillus alvei]MCY9586747.1 MoxR family ATPase [Paenibacillus alvei]
MTNEWIAGSGQRPQADNDVWMTEFAQRGWVSYLERMEQVIIGKREVVKMAGISMLSGGHILLEDVPGVGKTVLARALARIAGGTFRRIQMTPDMMPADITGSMVWEPSTGELRYSEGALQANVVLADELNRAPARTQSALLEAMEERMVTVDGTTRPLPDPFMLIGTQNPHHFEGTYRMPEAEADRFMMRLSIGYPHAEQEADMLLRHQDEQPLLRLKPLWTPEEWRLLVRRVQSVHVDEVLCRYMAELALATRVHEATTLGVSPRGTLALMRASQAHAWIEGRTYAVPDDVQAVAIHVMSHRLLLQPQVVRSGVLAEEIVLEVLQHTAVPGFPTGSVSRRAGGGGSNASAAKAGRSRQGTAYRASDSRGMSIPPVYGAESTPRQADNRIWFGGLFR